MGQEPNHIHTDPEPSLHVDLGDRAMVVSDSAAASRIGREVLARGGTAVDAAVATAIALAVAWPDAGNIGGGGFMLIRPGDDRDPVCVDYRETAPQGMHAHSFDRDDTTFSHKAVGVPGTVRGLALAHQRFGKLPWRDLVLPAADLASDGVPIDPPLADSLNSVLAESLVKSEPRFAELRRVYGRSDGKPWKAGDRLTLPDLARTLRLIAEQGPDGFYQGSVAEALVAEMGRGDGLITLSDLQQYRAKFREVIRGEYRGYTILGAPPPSSGGICVVQALNILENFELASRGRYDPITIHLIAEASRRAFADRARYLGDPDHVAIPDHLTDKAYARELAAGIDLNRATPSASLTPEIAIVDESPDTTHFSVVDADGMAVSNTYTLEASWGSRIVVRGAGFVLNNEMGDFNWFPGETNTRGRIGTAANIVAGGKRMLSSQSPTILEKEGRLVMVTGSPGGRSIINTVLCTLINVIDFQQPASLAVGAARMHHQWFPDQIELERMDDNPHAQAVSALRAMGHRIRDRPAQGSAHTIAVDADPQQLIGIADFRRGGRPAAIRSRGVTRWDFSEPASTGLSEVAASGSFTPRWNASIDGIETDGRDRLRIRTSPPMELSPTGLSASVSLPDLAGTWSVEVKIDVLRFRGFERNERIRFVLGEGLGPESPAAAVVLARRPDNSISLHAETVRELSDPFELSTTPTLGQPVIVRLSVDPRRGAAVLSSRRAAEERFTEHASLMLRESWSPNRFGLGVLNDFSDAGEAAHIDRIELLNGDM
jgi:gamma-glutamyltranspeptidase/glutathione hydrolase